MDMEMLNGLGSLLVACIEVVLLVNLLVFAEKNKLNIPAMLIIALLALYQTFEFLMCQAGLVSPEYPYLTFVVITFLPPLNFYFTSIFIKNKFFSKLSLIVFIAGIFFIAFYTIRIKEFAVTQCTVLYARYNYPLGDVYGFYYYIPILGSIVMIVNELLKTSDAKQKTISKILLAGSLFISIPPVTGLVLTFWHSYDLISVVVSVMCKFAIVYALCLGFICLYNSPQKNERKNS